MLVFDGDHDGHLVARDLHAHVVRRDVEQHDLLELAAHDARVHRRAHRDDLVGVDALARGLAEDRDRALLHRRHAGHAADEQHLIDVRRRAVRIGERLPARRLEPLEQRLARALELAALELAHQVDRPGRARPR